MEQTLAIRDIHLPVEIGNWPPAIGWWLLLILVPLCLFMCWWLYKRLTRRTATKSAKKILEAIKQDPQSDDWQKLQQISVWLRRVAISIDSREQSASLTGTAWLNYLDESIDGSPFSEGIGQSLADAHFRKIAPDNLDILALIDLCELWLKGQKS